MLPALPASNSFLTSDDLPVNQSEILGSQNIEPEADATDHDLSRSYKHADGELLELLNGTPIKQNSSAQGVVRAWAAMVMLGLLSAWVGVRTRKR